MSTGKTNTSPTHLSDILGNKTRSELSGNRNIYAPTEDYNCALKIFNKRNHE